MEALFCVFLCRFTRCAIDAYFLPVVCCSFADTFHSSEQVFVESGTDDWTANVVS